MPEGKRENMPNADLVMVWTGSSAEAAVVRATLQQHHISAITVQKGCDGLIPAMMPESFRVMVLEADAARASAIIKERREVQPDRAEIKVLFVCTHNRFRSQMAEGFLRALGGERFEVFSAGTEPQGPNPEAIKTMKEVGIDISGHAANHINEFLGKDLDYVITVCDDANEKCPAFPGKCKHLHWSFENPSRFTGPPAEIEEKILEVRDAIRERIVNFLR